MGGLLRGGFSAYDERNLIAGWLEIEPPIAVFWVALNVDMPKGLPDFEVERIEHDITCRYGSS